MRTLRGEWGERDLEGSVVWTETDVAVAAIAIWEERERELVRERRRGGNGSGDSRNDGRCLLLLFAAFTIFWKLEILDKGGARLQSPIRSLLRSLPMVACLG